MDASGSRLCQIIQGAGLWPRTAQHFQTVLATAGIVALTDAGFASRMDDMMVNSIRKFTAVKKRADDLAVLLQPARPGSSLPATLIGLHGDELFQAKRSVTVHATVWTVAHCFLWPYHHIVFYCWFTGLPWFALLVHWAAVVRTPPT